MPGEWKKICCAVDFSEASRAAMDAAIAAAKYSGAELWLVHVVTPVPAARHSPTWAAEATHGVTTEARQALDRWQADAEKELAKPVKATVVVGDPADELVRVVRSEECDLLVVGTHGRSGIPRLVLGSVAERLVRQAPCSVLVARRGDLEVAKIAEEAAQYRGG